MNRSKKVRLRALGGLLLAGVAVMATMAACGDGEDRPGVVVVEEGSASVSVSGTGTGTGTGTATGTGTGTGTSTDTGTGTGTMTATGVAEPGVVEPAPAGAAQVTVDLSEWAVSPDTNTVRAGEVYFLANNIGPDDPHELVIIRTDLAPGALPVNRGSGSGRSGGFHR